MRVLKSNRGFPGSSAGVESTCNAGDPPLIPGLGRSAEDVIGYPLQHSWVSLMAQLVKNMIGFNLCVCKIPGEGNGYILQYSGLENSMDCTAHRVTKDLEMSE